MDQFKLGEEIFADISTVYKTLSLSLKEKQIWYLLPALFITHTDDFILTRLLLIFCKRKKNVNPVNLRMSARFNDLTDMVSVTFQKVILLNKNFH